MIGFFFVTLMLRFYILITTRYCITYCPEILSEQWIEMPVYNKLKIAILAIITTPTAYALTLDPIEVQSGAGNLLYAEMKFHNADPNARIEASLAESNDLIRLGIGHQPPGHLNFFTRKSSDGSGVIVITSSRPMVESELNILIKIKEGNATHIQQIKTRLNRPAVTAQKAQITNKETSLIPQTVVSDKDIALNLPMSAQYNVAPSLASKVSGTSESRTTAPNTSYASSNTIGVPLAINVSPVPLLNNQTAAQIAPVQINTVQIATNKTANTTNSAVSKSYEQPTIAMVQSLPSTLTISETVRPASAQPAPATPTSLPKQELAATPEPAKPVPEFKAEPQAAASETAKATPQVQPEIKTAPTPVSERAHVVQNNESLWKIASRVATQTNQSIPEVMQQIKANNEHAFIGGNINRIRRGAALNLAATNTTTPKAVKGRPMNARSGQPQSGKEKYKLSQAEMKLVAESKQDSAQGAAKEKSSKNQTNPELSSKVMTARQKTVKLQQNVSQLTLAIQQKDQRIQLLNARLAQLQQQLQKKNQANKPAH